MRPLPWDRTESWSGQGCCYISNEENKPMSVQYLAFDLTYFISGGVV